MMSQDISENKLNSMHTDRGQINNVSYTREILSTTTITIISMYYICHNRKNDRPLFFFFFFRFVQQKGQIWFARDNQLDG